MTFEGEHGKRRRKETIMNERSTKLVKQINKFISSADGIENQVVRMEDLNFYHEEFKDVSSRLIDMGSVSQVNLLDEINTTITSFQLSMSHSTLRKKVTKEGYRYCRWSGRNRWRKSFQRLHTDLQILDRDLAAGNKPTIKEGSRTISKDLDDLKKMSTKILTSFDSECFSMQLAFTERIEKEWLTLLQAEKLLENPEPADERCWKQHHSWFSETVATP